MGARRDLAQRDALVGGPDHARERRRPARSAPGASSSASAARTLSLCATLPADCAIASDHDRGEPVGVVARGDRPRAGQRIDLGDHVDVVGREAERIGDDLRRDRRMPLAVGRAAQPQRHVAARVDRHDRARVRARLRLAARALLGGLRERHIGHVGAGRLDAGRDADAVEAAVAARFRRAAPARPRSRRAATARRAPPRSRRHRGSSRPGSRRGTHPWERNCGGAAQPDPDRGRAPQCP